MPREFIPQFYSEKRGERRRVIGAEVIHGGSKIAVQFSGGEYGIYDRHRLETLAGVDIGAPIEDVALCFLVMRQSYAALRVVPGSFAYADGTPTGDRKPLL